jgi:hypothetical protein
MVMECSPFRALVSINDNASGTSKLFKIAHRLKVMHAMRTAYRMACEEPRLKDAGDGMTEIVADNILELADAGETNPVRLCSAALRRLSH